MKKILASALTTAVLVGAASTTFAAANPFSDVPADHWAYDAVTQLAADGVIDGYGDTTFKGDRNITRYEMAQMVAKAMAKTNVGGNDKALIDKLSAEFADELNNLGVRVAKLERNADMVKWNGLMEYTYTSTRHDADSSKTNDNDLTFRLEPHAEINNHWTVNARLDADTKMDSDSSSDSSVKLKRVWAEGNYPNLNVKFGKLPNSVNVLSTTDDPFSGVAVTFGKVAKVTLEAGRLDATQFGDMGRDATGRINDGNNPFKGTSNDTANFQAIAVNFDNGGKLTGGVAYENLTGEFKNTLPETYDNSATDNDFKAGIWSAIANYRFNKNAALKAEYAYNAKADNNNKAGSIQFDYKGADQANKGSWGAYLAYRHLGQYAAPWSTYGDGVDGGQKGFEVGTSYALFRNVVFYGKYFKGKDIVADRDAQKLFARVDFFF